MRIKLLLILLMIPYCSLAQVMINGRILNRDTKKPMADVSVFLNNASIGTKTNADGTFTLFKIKPGRYTLVATTIGYQTHSQTIMVGHSDIVLAEIILAPKTIMLKEVIIKPTREQYMNDFKTLFLGPTQNAKQCTILNPEVINVDYDENTRILTASSDDFIIIENKALGYLIKYKLTTFTYSSGGSFYYEGLSLFEDLKGSDKQQRKWKHDRQVAYLGSSVHFLRSVIANQTAADGFKVLKLVRNPNPFYQESKDAPGSKYIQSLYNKNPLNKSDYTGVDSVGLFSLSFKDCLYVMYTKGISKVALTNLLGVADNPITVLTLKKPSAFFDNNGIIINTRSIIYEGDWSNNRIAELLPVDYEPEVATQ